MYSFCVRSVQWILNSAFSLYVLLPFVFGSFLSLHICLVEQFNSVRRSSSSIYKITSFGPIFCLSVSALKCAYSQCAWSWEILFWRWKISKRTSYTMRVRDGMRKSNIFMQTNEWTENKANEKCFIAAAAVVVVLQLKNILGNSSNSEKSNWTCKM